MAVDALAPSVSGHVAADAVALRYVGTGQVDIRVVVETGDPGMEKTDKRAEPLIVDSEEAANTSLQEAKLGEITFPGARVKVRD